MRKGKITINKKGSAKINPEDGKELSVPKEFDFGKYTPESGKLKLECQFEGNPVSKIVIEGKEVPKDQGVVAEKQNQKERVAQREAETAQRKKEAAQKARAKKSGNDWDDSFEAQESCLPADTQAILKDSDNFYLKLNKAPRYIEGKFYFVKNDFSPKRQTGHKFKIHPNFGNFSFEQNCANLYRRAEKYCAQVAQAQLEVDWHLVSGLGYASVYETSITLHHVYGVPYIPASSIKGVVRSWMIQEKYFAQLTEQEQEAKDAGEKAERKALQDQAFCDLFGCDDKSYYREARQGQVIFFDAFPCTEPVVDVDIMNPHYPDYYGGSQLPTDFQNPVPIPFLVVSNQDKNNKPLKFQFVVGIKNKADASLLATAQEWLTKTLTEHGIGAKTAVGYGYMK